MAASLVNSYLKVLFEGIGAGKWNMVSMTLKKPSLSPIYGGRVGGKTLDDVSLGCLMWSYFTRENDKGRGVCLSLHVPSMF